MLIKIILLLVVQLLIFQNALASPSSLFEVSVTLSESDLVKTKQKQFDTALAKAVRIELIKLSGDLSLAKRKEVKPLLKTPRKWLERYQHVHIKKEGVVIGQQIRFVFNEQKLYKFFQENNLVIWPRSERPITLVYGSQKLDTRVVKIKQQNIANLLRLDFRWSASRLVLPIVIPTKSSPWVFPGGQHASLDFKALLQAHKANFVMTFQEEIKVSGARFFTWQLYNKQGLKVKSGRAENKRALTNLRNVFASLLGFYSKQYRQSASILNSMTIEVSGLNNFTKFKKAETLLQKLKPTVHQVNLTKMIEDKAVFEMVYQGSYDKFIEKLTATKTLKLMPNSGSLGRLEASFIAKDNKAF